MSSAPSGAAPERAASAPTPDAPGALATPVRQRIAYSEITPAQSPNWVAQEAGSIAAGLASPPQPAQLRRLGFTSLLNLAAGGEQSLDNVAFASEDWLRRNEATAQAFTNALVESIHYATTNPEYTQRVIAQYLKLDDLADAAEAYDFYIARHLRRLPERVVEAGRQYLEEMAGSDARAVGARADDFFDRRFAERAAASGLVERLYGAP